MWIIAFVVLGTFNGALTKECGGHVRTPSSHNKWILKTQVGTSADNTCEAIDAKTLFLELLKYQSKPIDDTCEKAVEIVCFLQNGLKKVKKDINCLKQYIKKCGLQQVLANIYKGKVTLEEKKLIKSPYVFYFLHEKIYEDLIQGLRCFKSFLLHFLDRSVIYAEVYIKIYESLCYLPALDGTDSTVQLRECLFFILYDSSLIQQVTKFCKSLKEYVLLELIAAHKNAVCEESDYGEIYSYLQQISSATDRKFFVSNRLQKK
ncbi:hypothetical protein CEXT_524181 [Caerostris extrusa]|uniref:Uncharacterized protein n=1 Tax=Caerostris extrusa TaxID=172846 RepID=A0AAV4SHH5_CAEEX|nr:hypothetical protein CEXT_524181 [Caerostris extrusa]